MATLRPTTVRPAGRTTHLPPLRVHHLLGLLAVAAVAAALQRGVRESAGPQPLPRELAEMTYWLGAALGTSLWGLGLWWWARGEPFLRQPGPWLLAASIVETGFLGRLAGSVELLVVGPFGPLAQELARHWNGRWWSLIPMVVVGALLLVGAALPSRLTTFGPLWRVLLAMVGLQLLACAALGPWPTSQGRWQGWRLSTWTARARGSAALAVAAAVHDGTIARRRRHWSHTVAVALWLAMQLGRNLATGD